MDTPTLNIAAYKFVTLTDLPTLRSELLSLSQAHALKGTILLAHEGINLFMAGSESAVRAFLANIRERAPFADLTVKESWSDEQPFGKLLVKLKKEIIPLGRPDIDPARDPAPRVAPQDLKRWLDQGHDDNGRQVVLLDTRNTYEVEHGTFAGAVDMNLDVFRNFGNRLPAVADALQNKTIVSFCTGGIRCEKAAPLMLKEGFRDVYQLDGGILKYFEECGSAHFVGDCYVFDERAALDSDLVATHERKV
ncbi:MAG: sulfurtransferase [Betaproteobacteria bacterium]|nr:sulfurtransferase [Betaproteobacteria bacterium]